MEVCFIEKNMFMIIEYVICIGKFDVNLRYVMKFFGLKE